MLIIFSAIHLVKTQGEPKVLVGGGWKLLIFTLTLTVTLTPKCRCLNTKINLLKRIFFWSGVNNKVVHTWWTSESRSSKL